MIISEGTFNCFLSTLSAVAKTRLKTVNCHKFIHQMAGTIAIAGTGKFLIPRNIHIVICIFRGLPPGQTGAGARPG